MGSETEGTKVFVKSPEPGGGQKKRERVLCVFR